MIRMRLFLPLLTILGVCVCAFAQDMDLEIRPPDQEVNLEEHPGYIYIEDIKISDRDGRVTDISLGPAFLRFARNLTEDEDADLGRFISGIFSIRVKAFEVDLEESEKVKKIMDKFVKKMEEAKWERLVRVKKEDERLDVRVKFDGEKAVGIFLMAHDPGDEAAFVNVVGDNIDFKHIGSLGKGLFGFHCDWFR